MGYSWRVYKAMWDEEFKGFIYAHNEAEARQAWIKSEGSGVNALVEIEEVEFYISSPEEGGYVLFLHPDELVDHFIEPDQVNIPHVFYMVGVEDE
jgi:hypothetical protein